VPYNARAKAVVSVSGQASLGEVIDRAAEIFGVLSRTDRSISSQVPCIAFFKDEDELGMAGDAGRWHGALRSVDGAGEPSWAVRWSEMHIGELAAVSKAGLLDGDPLRPYFWPVIPQGTVTELAGSLLAMWAIWEHVLAGIETSEAARRLVDRIRRSKNSVELDEGNWRAWLARPQILIPYLDETPRKTAEIVADTGIPGAQLEGALLGMGYTMQSDGRWRPGTDPAARALRVGLLEIKRCGHGPEDIAAAAERVQELVEKKPPDDSDQG
jgi:hypothetical protein